MKRSFLFTVLLLSLSTQALKAQYTPWDIIYCLNGGENKTVGILKLPDPNPMQKPGWNLIFKDEFHSDSLDPDKWNRSNPWDDGSGSCVRGFAVNPNIPSVEDNIARVSNSLESFLPGCPYSASEIKTMSVSDPLFRSFYFYAPGYLEARVKLFNKTGQGASFWLWGVGTSEDPGTPGPWNEVDIFELNGVNSNIFSGTFHWTFDGDHVSQNHSIQLTDSAGLYDLSSTWTTFGLEWDTNSIKWFVNNSLVKELDLHGIPPYCVHAPTYGQPDAPYCIRLFTGNNTVGNQSAVADPADFPQSMLIDYVRAYKRMGAKAAPIIIQDNLPQICATATSYSTSDKFIRTRYYPGVIYEWSSPAFEMALENLPIPQPPDKMKIWIKQGIPAGQTYPVFLHTVFPDGHAEWDTAFILITPGVPQLPSNNFQPIQIDSLCYFTISARMQTFSAIGEYSFDHGSSWIVGTNVAHQGGTYCQFGKFKAGQNIQFSYREKNGCGISEARVSSITMPQPAPGCKWPSAIDDSLPVNGNGANPPVSIFPNPVLENLEIKLAPSLHPEGTAIRWAIYDIHARSVFQRILNQSVTQINLSHLHQGIYCVLVFKDNQVIYKTTLVKK